MMSDCVLKENLYIITGAPGVGKSTLISRFGEQEIVETEPAREIIGEQRALGGTGLWEKDRKLFVDLLLSRSIEKYTNASGKGGRMFSNMTNSIRNTRSFA